MNREIKFRAWDKEKKWFIRYYVINSRGEAFLIGRYIFDDVDLDVELMQYTGLKDKNGKEIYEGDIVRYVEDYIQEDLIKRSIGEINYSGSSYKIDGIGSLEDWGEVEVIGNIYENPELLKK